MLTLMLLESPRLTLMLVVGRTFLSSALNAVAVKESDAVAGVLYATTNHLSHCAVLALIFVEIQHGVAGICC